MIAWRPKCYISSSMFGARRNAGLAVGHTEESEPGMFWVGRLPGGRCWL